MYTIPKLTRRRLDITLLVIAIFVILSWLLTGCVTASRDPLGTPAKTARERPEGPDYATRGGVICRELTGTLKVDGVQGTGQGFRCLDVGEQTLEGCLSYEDGRFSYTSPGCEGAP